MKYKIFFVVWLVSCCGLAVTVAVPQPLNPVFHLNDCGDCNTVYEQTYPNVTGRDLTAIWGTGANDIWAGGDGGTLIHYDGIEWSKNQNPFADQEWDGGNKTVTDIWGDRLDNCFALMTDGRWPNADDTLLLHWNGQNWNLLPEPPTGSYQGTSLHGFIDGNLVVMGMSNTAPLNTRCAWT